MINIKLCLCQIKKIWENGFKRFRIGSYIQVIKIASGILVDGKKDKKRLLLTIFLKGWGYATITLYLQTRKCWPRDNVCLTWIHAVWNGCLGWKLKRFFWLKAEDERSLLASCQLRHSQKICGWWQKSVNIFTWNQTAACKGSI